MKILSALAGIQKIAFFAGFLVIGILFTVFAGFGIFGEQEETVEIDSTIVARYDRTEGTDDIATEYARVRYTVDGKEYVGEVPCSSSEKVGDTMKIAYHPSTPGEPFSAGAEWLPYLFFVLGIVIILVTLFLAARAIIRKLR